MLNNFIIIQAQHHLEDGQICQGGLLENSMRYELTISLPHIKFKQNFS
jgi:hypothetical protein